MKAFETTATVDKSGSLSVAGVPFAPGTEVEIIVRAKPANPEDSSAENGQPLTVSEAFARVRAGNTESVGAMRREERTVTINSMAAEGQQLPEKPGDAKQRANVANLFAALDKARNTESVGSFRREELYDRKVLR